MNTVTFTLITGLGATVLLDLWGLARKPLLGLARPDYAPLGRWIAHMRHGRFQHESIAAAAAVRGERAIGWCAHYATGVAFAGLLLAIGGAEWMEQPAPGLAVAFGIGTVAAPFFLMQPGMGAGIAASRTHKPGAARLQALVTHTVFGFGLYAAALLAQFVLR
jgi:hypothetical protein